MHKNVWQSLPRPLVALAPMDGYTDSAFRRVCKTVNPTIVVFTEFTSVDGLYFAPERLKERLRFSPDEPPIIAQIFGNNEQRLIEAAHRCEQLGFSGIDLNMGCPAKNIVKSEQGFALRRTPEKAFAMIEALTRSVSIPISVKTRLGEHDASDLIDFGRGVENAGCSLITVHGRTYDHPYATTADFEPIYELQRHLSIPVIGNGGITSLSDGKDKLKNLAGYMIGQAALGNPWVFAEEGAPLFPQRIPLILQHIEWMEVSKGHDRALREIRKHLLCYVRGVKHAKDYRARLARVTDIEEVSLLLNAVAQESI
ncbi:MAG: tRNA-dihydrouridine synthase family protein [bacterium]